jgi:hypothetical protein
MKIKWLFYFFSLLFFLNIAGCHVISEYLSKRGSKPDTTPYEKGAITIAWDSSTDPEVAGYRIYYGFSPKRYDNSVDIGKPAELSPGIIEYTLMNLAKGKQYYIAVVALNKQKQQSHFSVEINGVAK